MEIIEVESADQLLETIRASNERWKRSVVVPTLRPLWLFRGQMDATWDLVPSRFRQGSIDLTKSKAAKPDPLGTRYREFSTLQTFQAIADREGLLPSGISMKNGPRSDGANPWWNDINIPIPYEVLDLYALAQHHGIPTRLLDWSIAPLSALYFAALGNWRAVIDPNTSAPSHFAVWAFVHHGSRQVNIFSSRYTDNVYLRSQRGRFTLDPNADLNYTKNNEWIPHNVLIEEDEQADDGTISTNRQMLVKIVVPSTMSEEILISLRYEGVDQASLMPSLDSIAECTLDEIELHKKEFSM